MNRALALGEFYCVQLHISRTGRPDMEYLAKELHYIAKYAIHKAKQLEEALWVVVGVCDVIDTTAATLQRLGINTKTKTGIPAVSLFSLARAIKSPASKQTDHCFLKFR